MNTDSIDQLQRDWANQRPDLDPQAFGVVLRIQALARLLLQKTGAGLAEFGLQWWQYDLLSALRRRGAPYRAGVSELGADVMLTSGAMTNRIDRLSNDGLVRRTVHPKDRRKVRVELTGNGLRLVDKATTARFELAGTALQCLGSRQRRELADLLRLMMLEHEDQV